jgi:hypothetical protein
MKPSKPRFLVSDLDKSFNFMNIKIVSTRVDGKQYIFYKHQDGSTKLMLRDEYYAYLDRGLIVEPGRPEDIPGLSEAGEYIK